MMGYTARHFKFWVEESVIMTNRFMHLLRSRPYLLADGATGTNLFSMGLTAGEVPEFWNVEHPDRIAKLHQGFIEAGSDIVLTNSFGGNRYRLELNNAQDRVSELNEAAARIARRQADAADREVVAGSMGPTGQFFAPLGPLSFEDGKAAFAEQAQALARGGVDVLWLETLSSLEEAEAAIAGAATAGLPIVATMSFDTNGRTMMGVTPADLTQLCQRVAPTPVAYGANCGIGAAEVVVAILNMDEAADPNSVFVAKANCSFPEFVDGSIRYNGATPEFMADYARLARDAGARIIGGCCGTRPLHIQAMRAALDGYEPGEKPDLAAVEVRLGEVSNGAQAQHRGEMDPLSGVTADVDVNRRTRRCTHRHA